MRFKVNTWFAERLGDHGIYNRFLEDHHPVHMPCLEVRRLDWSATAAEGRRLGMRLVALWAAEGGAHEASEGLYAYMAFAHPDHRHVLLRTAVGTDAPELPSISGQYIAALRMERTAADMFGIRFTDIPDTRPWIRHEHWPADAHPLRRSFARDSRMPHADGEYPFIGSGSEGVHEIPVGPVHAGIIEPGHFRFLVVGEQILNLEERLGYVHKGIEKTMQGKRADDGVRLAGRVSGDSTVAHAWAFSQACEYAALQPPPTRASFIRGVLCERERMANHIGDIGAVCNDVAFAFMQIQMQRLREEMARLHFELFGHRLLMDRIVPGGVVGDLDTAAVAALREQTARIAGEVEQLRAIYADHASVQERVVGSGIIGEADACDIGLLGFAGRASGHYADERIEEAYPPYDQVQVKQPHGKEGDVAARIRVRFDEIADSARIIDELLEKMPAGAARHDWTPPEAGVSGFSAVESWRGEIACWVRFSEGGRIDRYAVRDPSVTNWLALELAARGVPVPDFPLNNKSFNCSYSGNDL